MAAKKQTEICQYRFYGHEICDEVVEDGQSFCVTHREKRTDAERDKFKEIVAERMQRKDSKRHDFRGFIFPESFDMFKDMVFDGGVSFRDAHFEGGAYFQGAVVKGTLDFRGVVVKETASFNNATVEGRKRFGMIVLGEDIGAPYEVADPSVFLAPPWPSGSGNVADFQRARFERRANFQNATFGVEAAHGRASFYCAEFGGKAFFRDAKFHCDAGFESAVFEAQADFAGGKFAGNLSFADAVIRGALEMEGASFSRGPTFYRVAPPESGGFDRKIHVPRGEGEATYRMAKRVYQNMGHYDQAGDFHYMERCEIWHEKRLKAEQDVTQFLALTCEEPKWLLEVGTKWFGGLRTRLKREPKALRHLAEEINKIDVGTKQAGMPWRWRFVIGEHPFCKVAGVLWSWLRSVPELVLYRGIWWYGEKPRRIALISAVLIFVMAIVFLESGAVLRLSTGKADQVVSEFSEALYFSVVTFTTLGLGDFQPIDTWWSQALVEVEALAGVLLIAAFLVSFARRWGRG